MIGTESLLIDGKGSLVERFGLRVPTLDTVKFRKIVQRVRNIGMIGTEGFFTDGKRSFMEWFGICIPALVFVKCRKIVQ
jgi:hypothetical protein